MIAGITTVFFCLLFFFVFVFVYLFIYFFVFTFSFFWLLFCFVFVFVFVFFFRNVFAVPVTQKVWLKTKSIVSYQVKFDKFNCCPPTNTDQTLELFKGPTYYYNWRNNSVNVMNKDIKCINIHSQTNLHYKPAHSHNRYVFFFFFFEFFFLMAHNWRKWKSRFLTCHCHEIYRAEAVGLNKF